MGASRLAIHHESEESVSIESYDPVSPPRHADIGNIRGPTGQQVKISGGDMSMRSQNSRDPPVEVPAHALFLAGSLSLQVNNDDLGSSRSQVPHTLIGCREWRGHLRAHKKPAQEVEDTYAGAFDYEEAKTTAGKWLFKVQGTNDP